ncbi:MAG: hypothetical protein H0T89_26040 [Deltaproteobacteria bacterium]|nr:hypothetical protein [Deltaproteobacteria bacterium]MDQ3297624.1 hypothetical protein [Myxococcota bacterium]
MRQRFALPAALFAIGLVVYGALAWERLGKQSGAPHFVYQADAWLHGQVSVDRPLPNDDWAVVETVELVDGSQVSGRRLVTRRLFRSIDGVELDLAQIKRSLGHTAYVSFPPVPSLIMLPGAMLHGRAANDVIPTILIAALILPLAFSVLRRLAAAGLSTRSLTDDLWLVAMLGFGSVLFFSAVQGKVWYTAHVVGVALALGYAWASIEARSPLLAGLALGAAALTRTPMAFMFPLFLFEAWRMAARHVAASDTPAGASASMNLRAGRAAMRRALVKPLVRFAIPIAGFAILGMIYNQVRFGSPTEFGHSYLALGDFRPVRQQVQIEQFGLASYHYLERNLAVAFTLLPDLLPRAPFVQVSGHGVAMWVTTPLLLYVVWPRDKNALHRPLWITVALVALPSLLYMNSGWVQFGYRFSLDYMVFLMMLVAIGGRPLRGTAKALIVAGIVVNLFGAATFDRAWKYYRVGGNAYDVVVPH